MVASPEQLVGYCLGEYRLSRAYLRDRLSSLAGSLRVAMFVLPAEVQHYWTIDTVLRVGELAAFSGTMLS